MMPLPLAPDAAPTDVIIRAKPGTTGRQLYATISRQFSPPGVPFVFVKARDGSIIPDSTTTVSELGLGGTVIEQRLVVGYECHACVRDQLLREARTASHSLAAPSVASHSTLGLPAHIEALEKEAAEYFDWAAKMPFPTKWKCPVCTVNNDWGEAECPTCNVGGRPASAEAREALRSAAGELEEEFEKKKREFLSESASRAQSSDLRRVPSSGEEPTLIPRQVKALKAWMSGERAEDIDEDDLPERMLELKAEHLEALADAKAPAARMRSYICPSCSLKNAWSNTRCAVCDRPRPPIDASRTLLQQFAENLMMLAKREFAAHLSQRALSLTASTSGVAAAASHPSSPAEAADTPGSEHLEDLRTFIVFGGTVTLCSKHKCGWLEELYTTQELENSDLPRITVDTVLASLDARLI